MNGKNLKVTRIFVFFLFCVSCVEIHNVDFDLYDKHMVMPYYKGLVISHGDGRNYYDVSVANYDVNIINYDSINFNRLLIWKEKNDFYFKINEHSKKLSKAMNFESLSDSILETMNFEFNVADIYLLSNIAYKYDLMEIRFMDDPKCIVFQKFNYDEYIYLYNSNDYYHLSLKRKNLEKIKNEWYLSKR